MANINDIVNELTNGEGAKLYAGDGIEDAFILFDNLVKLQYNVSIKYNKQSIPVDISIVNFTDKVGQAAFPDASYIILPYAVDATGIHTPIKLIPGLQTATGFSVDNESGVVLDLTYICIKL